MNHTTTPRGVPAEDTKRPALPPSLSRIDQSRRPAQSLLPLVPAEPLSVPGRVEPGQPGVRVVLVSDELANFSSLKIE